MNTNQNIDFKNTKIFVATPAISAMVQEALFENGCYWDRSTEGTRVEFSNAKYLFIDSSGCITYENNDYEYFNGHRNKEIEADIQLKFSIKEKEIEIDGKKYKESELKEIINKYKEKVDGWIAHDCVGKKFSDYPDELNEDTQVKLKFRNGDRSSCTALAGDWDWGDAGNPDYQIVAYKIVR